MNADQINELKDTFRRAMLDWDVAVSVTIFDEDYADVSFKLWGTDIEGCFRLEKNKWVVGHDCPHYITNSTTAWQWIAMKLHEKLTA